MVSHPETGSDSPIGSDQDRGRDRLSRHHATMDCFRKEVKFYRPGEPEITFCGVRKILSSSMMSVMMAGKMLRKSYPGYLAYVVEVRDVDMRC